VRASAQRTVSFFAVRPPNTGAPRAKRVNARQEERRTDAGRLAGTMRVRPGRLKTLRVRPAGLRDGRYRLRLTIRRSGARAQRVVLTARKL